jgi:hypothetical protein
MLDNLRPLHQSVPFKYATDTIKIMGFLSNVTKVFRFFVKLELKWEM